MQAEGEIVTHTSNLKLKWHTAAQQLQRWISAGGVCVCVHKHSVRPTDFLAFLSFPYTLCVFFFL